MTDPTRLLERPETGQTALELLRALDAPTAPPPAVQAALAQQLSSMVAGAGTKAALGAVWIKATALIVAALGAGTVVWSVTSTPPRSAPVAAAPQPVERNAPAASAEPMPARLESVAPAPSRSARIASAAPARDMLAEEEALLEAARSAVSRDPAHALSLLQRHRGQFPRGQLSAERMFLSVDCYKRLGNLAAAKREAATLTRQFPNSTYARRAPQLLGTTE